MTSPDMTPEEIEEFARFLCDSDGNKSDTMVTAFEPMRGRGYLARHRILEAEHCWHPAWYAYQSIAVAALSHIRLRNARADKNEQGD